MTLDRTSRCLLAAAAACLLASPPCRAEGGAPGKAGKGDSLLIQVALEPGGPQAAAADDAADAPPRQAARTEKLATVGARHGLLAREDQQAGEAARAKSKPGAEAQTWSGAGCDMGRSLLIAALDQPELTASLVTDDRSLTPLSVWHRTFVKGGPDAEGREMKAQSDVPPAEEVGLGGWGHLAQTSPVLLVMALSFNKMRDALARNSATVSARNVLEISASLVLYCLSGPAVILVNKHLMRHYKFHFPIVLASLGNLLLMIVTRTVVALGWYKLETECLGWARYFKVVVPINIFNFLTQTLGLYAFLFISVPEIQILKSVTIIMVLFFAWLLVNEKLNLMLVSSVVVIALGVVMSAMFDGEAKIRGTTTMMNTVIGVTLMVLASTSEAAKTVISQVLMDKMPLFDGIYHSSPTFVLIACVFVGCMEAKGLAEFKYSSAVVVCLISNAVITGVIVLSSFWFVKLAGAVTLKVVTQARSIGLILCSVFFFGEFCTSVQYLGYTVTLVGMGMFDYAKQVLKSEDIKGSAKSTGATK